MVGFTNGSPGNQPAAGSAARPGTGSRPLGGGNPPLGGSRAPHMGRGFGGPALGGHAPAGPPLGAALPGPGFGAGQPSGPSLAPPTSGFGAPYGPQSAMPPVSSGVVKAPSGILWAGIALSVLGLANSAILLLDLVYPDTWQLWVAILTWALCVVGGLGSAILYMRTNTKRQVEKNYDISSDSRALYSLVVVLAVLSIAAAAAKFALLIGRM